MTLLCFQGKYTSKTKSIKIFHLLSCFVISLDEVLAQRKEETGSCMQWVFGE